MWRGSVLRVEGRARCAGASTLRCHPSSDSLESQWQQGTAAPSARRTASQRIRHAAPSLCFSCTALRPSLSTRRRVDSPLLQQPPSPTMLCDPELAPSLGHSSAIVPPLARSTTTAPFRQEILVVRAQARDAKPATRLRSWTSAKMKRRTSASAGRIDAVRRRTSSLSSRIQRLHSRSSPTRDSRLRSEWRAENEHDR